MKFLRLAVLAMALAGAVATTIAFVSEWHWYADRFTHLRPQYWVWLALAVGSLTGC